MIFFPRTWFFFGFLVCLVSMLIAAWFQFVEELEPCPLCISQRIMIVAVGLAFLIATLHNPKRMGIRVYAIVGGILALMGAGISTRHVWLQHLPPEEVPTCGPGLAYIFENFPLSKTLETMLSGTGDCAEVLWTFLGLSIPAWTLICFLGLAALSLAQLWNTDNNTLSNDYHY